MEKKIFVKYFHSNSEKKNYTIPMMIKENDTIDKIHEKICSYVNNFHKSNTKISLEKKCYNNDNTLVCLPTYFINLMSGKSVNDYDIKDNNTIICRQIDNKSISKMQINYSDTKAATGDTLPWGIQAVFKGKTHFEANDIGTDGLPKTSFKKLTGGWTGTGKDSDGYYERCINVFVIDSGSSLGPEHIGSSGKAVYGPESGTSKYGNWGGGELHIDDSDSKVDVPEGYVPFGSAGINFVNFVPGQTSLNLATKDENSHGSHVLGTIAAAPNGSGVVGVSPFVRVFVLKIFPWIAVASDPTIMKAFNFVKEIVKDRRDAYKHITPYNSVVNVSLHTQVPNPKRWLDLIHPIADLGVSFSIAAGNSSDDVDFHTPAAAGGYPNVYTISASDNNYQMADFSNYDNFGGYGYDGYDTEDNCDYSAPGVDVLSYNSNLDLESFDGTSMAAPHVCGLLALHRHAEQTNLINVTALSEFSDTTERTYTIEFLGNTNWSGLGITHDPIHLGDSFTITDPWNEANGTGKVALREPYGNKDRWTSPKYNLTFDDDKPFIGDVIGRNNNDNTTDPFLHFPINVLKKDILWFEEVLELNIGWNLIGTSKNCQIDDELDIIEENTLYEFNESYPNTYTNVTTLKSNEGYYVFAKSAGTIKLVPV